MTFDVSSAFSDQHISHNEAIGMVLEARRRLGNQTNDTEQLTAKVSELLVEAGHGEVSAELAQRVAADIIGEWHRATFTPNHRFEVRDFTSADLHFPGARRSTPTPSAAPSPATRAPGTAAAVRDSYVVALSSPDDGHLSDDVHLDQDQTMGSWEQFPAMLRTLRQQQLHDPQHRPITLILNTHGNNGTGFKLIQPRWTTIPATADFSVASAAWINAQLRAAGFPPEDITIVSEACNAGSAYVSTVDGMDDAEQARATAEVQAICGQDTVLGSYRLFDVPGHQAPEDRAFRWVGRATGVNYAGSVAMQHLSGAAAPGSVLPGSARPGVPGTIVPQSAGLSDLNGLHRSDVAVSSNDVGYRWQVKHLAGLEQAVLHERPRLRPAATTP